MFKGRCTHLALAELRIACVEGAGFFRIDGGVFCVGVQKGLLFRIQNSCFCRF